MDTAAYLAAAGGGDDGWAASAVRVVVCFLAMALTTAVPVWAVLMLLLLPWPSQRIRQSNVYGHVTGRMLVCTRLLCVPSLRLLATTHLQGDRRSVSRLSFIFLVSNLFQPYNTE
jgi:hypothetical protein